MKTALLLALLALATVSTCGDDGSRRRHRRCKVRRSDVRAPAANGNQTATSGSGSDDGGGVDTTGASTGNTAADDGNQESLLQGSAGTPDTGSSGTAADGGSGDQTNLPMDDSGEETAEDGDERDEPTPASTPSRASSSVTTSPGQLILDGSVAYCANSEHWALTFDDGPFPGLTNQALDILADEGVPATFFVHGVNVARAGGAELVRRAFDEGHTIGNHAEDATPLTTLGGDAIRATLQATQDKISGIIGRETAYFRSPLFERTPYTLSVINGEGYVDFLTTFDTKDFETMPSLGPNSEIPNPLPADNGPNTPIGRLRDFLAAGTTNAFATADTNLGVISLAHDINAVTVGTLRQFIQLVRDAGYTFVSLEECTGIPAYR